MYIINVRFYNLSFQICTGSEFHNLDDVTFEEDAHPHGEFPIRY
jgi:hypothetical protein